MLKLKFEWLQKECLISRRNLLPLTLSLLLLLSVLILLILRLGLM